MRSRAAVLLLALCCVGCRSVVYDYVDGYLDAAQASAVQQAREAADAVGVPLETYAALWDVKADPGERYRIAAALVYDLLQNGVPLKDGVHVVLSVGAMLAYVYRPQTTTD
ncbi:MAG: hypothetical protein V3S01_05580 [Dehalococcoidia bacterium]